MTYTERHLEQIDAEITRPGRNGDSPKLSPKDATDPALKAAFKDVEMLWQATRLEKLQGKLKMLKKYESEIKAEAKEETTLKVVSISRTRWLLSAAAGVLLLVAVGWFLLKPDQPQTIQYAYLAEHFDEYVLHDVMKGVGTAEYTPEQLRAYNLFAIKDFNKAIPLLKKEWEKNGDTLSLFYLWVSYKAVGDEKKSELYKEEALELSKSSKQLQELVNPLIQ